MTLGEKTPAELAGIKVVGENRWMTLIQNASHDPKVDSKMNQVNDPKT